MTKIMPSDIDISTGLVGSEFNRAEEEIAACTIIEMSIQNNNKWRAFTLDEFTASCLKPLPRKIFLALNQLLEEGMLKLEDGKYHVQVTLFYKLKKFIKVPATN